MKFSRIALKHKYNGMPKVTDYEILEENLDDDLKAGEFFYEALYISLDPYTRIFAYKYNEGDTLPGYQLSRVTKSNNPKYPVGTILVMGCGWRNGGKDDGKDVWYIRNDIPEGVPQSAGCGILGMAGLTAHYGLKYAIQPKRDETLFVSGAAGAVGTVAGQIGKIMGCRVIGSCGSDEKVAFVKSVGFDDAFNYKKESVDDALKRLAPNGVDCYYDNVGGDFSSAVIRHMNLYGRIGCCGAISTYNETKPVKADALQTLFFKNSLTMKGFYVFRFEDKYDELYKELREFAREGKLKQYETITEGFENIPATFIGMLQGKNIGKAVIKV